MAKCYGTTTAAGAELMLVFTHLDCLLHEPGPGHPESPARLRAVTEALAQALPDLEWHEAPLAGRDQVARVHNRALLAQVLDTQASAAVRLDADTVLSSGSAQAALRACGAGIAAVDALMRDASAPIFCAVRPPGHHATADTAMGFCLFNSIAVAAAHALEVHGLQRVAILDFDVHHGNGTQAIFEHDPRVLYASSHQWPLYPDTGAADETGVGNVFNAPLPPGTQGETFREAWQTRLFPAVASFAPQILFISAGFDAHHLDPLADLRLHADDFRWFATQAMALAHVHAGGRIVAMLEGGYSLSALAECTVAFVQALQAGASAQSPAQSTRG